MYNKWFVPLHAHHLQFLIVISLNDADSKKFEWSGPFQKKVNNYVNLLKQYEFVCQIGSGHGMNWKKPFMQQAIDRFHDALEKLGRFIFTCAKVFSHMTMHSDDMYFAEFLHNIMLWFQILVSSIDVIIWEWNLRVCYHKSLRSGAYYWVEEARHSIRRQNYPLDPVDAKHLEVSGAADVDNLESMDVPYG